jgi:hypothetical protein
MGTGDIVEVRSPARDPTVIVAGIATAAVSCAPTAAALKVASADITDVNQISATLRLPAAINDRAMRGHIRRI